MDNRERLIGDILPFWLENAMDAERGGIFTCLDETGKIYGDQKSVWFQGRALWTFSKAYNIIEKNEKYLLAAKSLYEFIPKCEAEDGRLYFTVTADGRGIQKRRYYFSETFAAIGCAEYWRASGDVGALEAARKYFGIAYDCFMGVRYTEPKFNTENLALKSLSPVMIMLSTAQTMRAADTERAAEYNRIARECLDEILHGGFLTESALLEHVGTDGVPVDTPTGRIVNPGHSMEAAWFVMLEGILTNNEEAIEAGRRIIDLTYPIGWDAKRGGIFAFIDKDGAPPVQLEWDMKLWWPQCETAIAARMAYMLFGDERYKALYEQVVDYYDRYFVDAKNGEWYGYLHYDNTPSTTLKGNIFKGPFHIPRLYMIMSVMDRDSSIDAYAK